MYLVYNNLHRQFEPPHIAAFLYKGGKIKRMLSPTAIELVGMIKNAEVNGLMCGIVDILGDDVDYVYKEQEEITSEEIETEEPSLEELAGARQQNREQEEDNDEVPPWH